MKGLSLHVLYFALLVALLNLLPSSTATAQSGLRFGVDSISIRYTPCENEVGLVRYWIYNTSPETQQFSVRFRNQFASWMIDGPIFDSVRASYLDSLELAPGDSMQLEAYHTYLTASLYIDTLLIQTDEGTADSLYLIARTYATDISPQNNRRDIDLVGTGDSVLVDFEVTNMGEAIFITRYFYIDKEGWEIRNIAIGDSIMPGETQTVQVFFAPRSEPGPYSAYLRVDGICGSIVMNVAIEVVPDGLNWTKAMVRDTLRECRHGSEYTVTIMNTADHGILLDSIAFKDLHEYGWHFTTERPANVEIPAGGSVSMSLERNIHTAATILYSFSGGKLTDSVWIRIYDSSAVPVIKNFRDTLIFNSKAGDSFTYTGTIENKGDGRYKLQTMSFNGSPLWSMTLPDTAKWLANKRTIDYDVTFAGTTVPGEYAMTYTFTGVPCDTVLSQTLLVRVAEADVDRATNETALRVFPTITSHDISIEMGQSFTYSVIDLLGNTRISGTSVSGKENVYVGHLPQGRYFIRTESNGTVYTRAIAIER